MYESPAREKSQTIIYVALVISWIIILGGVRIVFFRDRSPAPVSEQEEVGAGITYFMGEQVMLKGLLTFADDISQFSHTLTDESGSIFGVKSFDVVLSSYTGMVQIKGEVVGFKQEMPIVQVSEIIGVAGSASGSTLSPSADGSYQYFEEAMLGVNLSAFPGFIARRDGTDIGLYDTTTSKILTITAFTCTPGDVTKDCTRLKGSLDESSRFTNADGMVFTRQAETDRWISFYETKKGYIFAPAPDSSLETYASAFSLIDPSMFTNRLDEMKMICKDTNSRLATIGAHEIRIEANGTVTVGIDGSTVKGVAASCAVKTSLRSPASFTLVSYTGPTTPEEGAVADDTLPAQEQPSSPAGSATPPPATTTTLSVPAAYASWKSYPSVRGWTMYVERNVISYNGSFGTGQAGCPYRLDLSYWTNLSGASADSVIYECTAAGASALKAAGYTPIGVGTGVEFLRKDITDGLQGVDIYIQ